MSVPVGVGDGGTAEAAPAAHRSTASAWVPVSTAVAGAVVGSAVVVAAALPSVLGDPGSTRAQRLPTWVLLLVAASIALAIAAVWIGLPHTPRASTALAWATMAAALPLLASQPWLPDRLRVAMTAATPVALAALLGVSGGCRGRWYAAVVSLSGVATVFLLLGYNPFEHPACRQICERVPSVIATRAAVTVAAVLTVAAAAIGSAHLRRRRFLELDGAVLAGAVILAVLIVVRWLTFDHVAPGIAGLPLEPLAVGVVGGAVCFLWVRALRVRAAVAKLVVGLSPESVLGGAVADVHFAFPGTDRWLDSTGSDLTSAPLPDRCVVLSDGSQPVARLVLGRRVDPADVVASLTSATRLALRNAQLSTVALARLAEVRASRRRVVTASDGERRRIERDLHDGAQQRLVGAGLHLRVALSDLSGKNRTVVRIEQAERKVLDALARLRRLAHGIFPRVLSDDGLEAALDELVLESDIPARLEVRIEDDLPANVSMAVYALVAAMLGSVTEPRPSTLCTIDVRLDGAVLMTLVTVEAGGAVVAGFDLTAVEDRIGAAGGELVMVAGGAKAVIPCEL